MVVLDVLLDIIFGLALFIGWAKVFTLNLIPTKALMFHLASSSIIKMIIQKST